MLSRQTIQEAVNRIVTASKPLKIIVFGSYAKGNATEDSDLDFLIIESVVNNKGKEMVCLRNIIGDIGVGVDVLVYSQNEVSEWGELFGTALYNALKEGKVVYEAAR